MVVVKVRETYDLHTVKDKMTVIGIHTPKPDIIKKNYPGLLMQCKAYRPKACNVRLACASILPLDPLGIGTEAGDVAPEDVFNPILYKAMSNKGMSSLEARINALSVTGSGVDIDGNSAMVDTDSFTNIADEFAIYYGLLSNTKDWKHANIQQGLSMSNLKPLVYEMVYNVGDTDGQEYEGSTPSKFQYPGADGYALGCGIRQILGKAKPMPFINCTSYSLKGSKDDTGVCKPGFPDVDPSSCSVDVPYIDVVVGAIIVPPSRLHSLYFRMVIEWYVEFSSIRPLGDLTSFVGLGQLATGTHYQNYSYSEAKKAITGDSDTILENEQCMVSANVNIDKVM